MAAALLTYMCIALIVFSLLILIQQKSLFVRRSYLALFLAVFFIDNLMILVTNRFSSLQIIPNTIWEGFLICSWSGKLYSIVCMIVLLFLTRKMLGKQDVGLTFHQNPGSVLPACTAILILSAWALLVGISSPKGVLDIQTLIYLAIMPGLNEELVYRGILFAILMKILTGNSTRSISSVRWSAILTSLLFGLLHGFWFDDHLTVHIEAIAFRNAAFSGLVFAWLRTRTGSLVLPVAAHGMEDFLFFLPRMV